MARLSDTEVDELADAMEQFAGGSKVSFENYHFVCQPGRKLGVLRATPCPREGVTTCASFGVAHEDWQHANFPHRIELVQAWQAPSMEYERLTVAVAEAIVASQRLPNLGSIYEGAATAARLPELAKRMPHALLLLPYLWGDKFNEVKLTNHRVWFLQVVPVYEDEKRFILDKGIKKFEELLSYDGAYFEKLDRLSHLEL